MNRPHDRIRLRQLQRVLRQRDAEVNDLKRTVIFDQYVLRLDIAVNDAVVMRMLKGAENADGDLDRGLIVQAALLADEIL